MRDSQPLDTRTVPLSASRHRSPVSRHWQVPEEPSRTGHHLTGFVCILNRPTVHPGGRAHFAPVFVHEGKAAVDAG
jgi:hypothetical protein